MKNAPLRLLVLSLLFLPLTAHADKVITKDGKVYTGKILIDSDKAVLIGNPPFDPNSTLIKAEDIQTIVYEQYQQNSPAERRRGINLDFQLSGNAYSSSELSLHPAAGLLVGGGFRFHPLIEIGGAVQWVPGVSASSNGLSLTNGTGANAVTRGYHDFWQYTLDFTSKIYPFYKKTKWKTEPYVLAGYGWSHLIPNSSGDSFKGGGWLLGFGAIRPITSHLFLDGRFCYQDLSYNSVNFLGNQATISPEIAEHTFSLSLGISYRI